MTARHPLHLHRRRRRGAILIAAIVIVFAMASMVLVLCRSMAVESQAATLEEVVAEIAATEVTERGQTRADDRVTEAAMEDRKRQGYF